jgi:hypothetical protein
MDGKVISCNDGQVIISKDGKQFQIDFVSYKLREINKQQ